MANALVLDRSVLVQGSRSLSLHKLNRFIPKLCTDQRFWWVGDGMIFQLGGCRPPVPSPSGTAHKLAAIRKYPYT